MLVNDLPDDCLLLVFNLVDEIDDLINFSKVCSRWNQLIKYRLIKVKYLLSERGWFVSYDPKATVYWRRESLIGVTHSCELLQNLKVIHIIQPSENTKSDWKEFAENNQSVIGLIYNRMNCEPFANPFPKLEAIAINWIDFAAADLKLRQIHLAVGYLRSTAEIAHLVNLKRLHVSCDCFFKPLAHYDIQGPMIHSLQILELNHSQPQTSQFIDLCPSLQSIFLHIPFPLEHGEYYLHTNESIKNENLVDLVIAYRSLGYTHYWTSLRTFLLKFPNLENLAIRGSALISDGNIKELVNILPKVKLLDFRTSPNVTARSADYLHGFCKRSVRSIVIYYDCEGGEPNDWPKIIETERQIVRGFYFMANCFYRRFESLPLILIPDDQ